MTSQYPLGSKIEAGQPHVVQAKRGRIENGVIVLTDPNDTPDREQPVYAIDVELAVIDAGLSEACKPERVHARLVFANRGTPPKR